jgi:hypothetical protein
MESIIDRVIEKHLCYGCLGSLNEDEKYWCPKCNKEKRQNEK